VPGPQAKISGSSCSSWLLLTDRSLRETRDASIIPPRRNAKPWRPTTPGARAGNEAIRASERFGRAIWRRWSGYHRRSRVEIKMHCIKLLGQRLTARDFDRQVSEFYLRIAILNQFTALGIPLTEAIQ
ncbi:transposase, partial [Acidomonas methanolica]|uniref:transposase n=1 Tax=Acidomonas methanolica TaxID=437 RepID=UPI0038CF8542